LARGNGGASDAAACHTKSRSVALVDRCKCDDPLIFEKLVLFRGFAAFSTRLQALNKQCRFFATQVYAAVRPPDVAARPLDRTIVLEVPM